MISKLKKAPAVERVNGFFVKVKNGWTTRKSAALFSAFMLCGNIGGITGCGSDNPLSSGSEFNQDIDLTGRRIAYVNTSGELTTGVVSADHGNILDMGSFELSESEMVGFAVPPGGADSITLAKGKHLDAYGDRFADIEYLHGMVDTEYVTLGDGETQAALVVVMGGTTSSGGKVTFSNEIGDDIDILVRRSDYWYDYE